MLVGGSVGEETGASVGMLVGPSVGNETGEFDGVGTGGAVSFPGFVTGEMAGLQIG